MLGVVDSALPEDLLGHVLSGELVDGVHACLHVQDLLRFGVRLCGVWRPEQYVQRRVGQAAEQGEERRDGDGFVLADRREGPGLSTRILQRSYPRRQLLVFSDMLAPWWRWPESR